MKFIIVVFILIGTTSLQEVNAYYFEDIERYWTASPTNSILYTANQSEIEQTIEFKKSITKDHPLLLTAEVSNLDTGDIVYKGSDLNICINYDRDTWDFFAVRLFDRALVPGPRRHKCPVEPQEYEVYRHQPNLRVDLSDNVPYAKYEIFYTARSDTGELVFSTLKFRFNHLQPATGFWRFPVPADCGAASSVQSF